SKPEQVSAAASASVPTTLEFLRQFVPASADGYLELRALNPNAQAFVKMSDSDSAEQISDFIAANPTSDHYYGVAERRAQDGKKAACSFLRALFADIDLKPDKNIEALRAFPLPPSVVVNSGNGLHA